MLSVICAFTYLLFLISFVRNAFIVCCYTDRYSRDNSRYSDLRFILRHGHNTTCNALYIADLRRKKDALDNCDSQYSHTTNFIFLETRAIPLKFMEQLSSFTSGQYFFAKLRSFFVVIVLLQYFRSNILQREI